MRIKLVFLYLIGITLLLLGLGTVALAYTNPELLQLVEKIAEYGLKGLKEYFNFLLELFKEAVKYLM